MTLPHGIDHPIQLTKSVIRYYIRFDIRYATRAKGSEILFIPALIPCRQVEEAVSREDYRLEEEDLFEIHFDEENHEEEEEENYLLLSSSHCPRFRHPRHDHHHVLFFELFQAYRNFFAVISLAPL